MNVVVNDKHYDVAEDVNVESLLESLSLPTKGIAVAVDGTVVPRPDWSSTKLTEGASIVVLKAFYGG
jgi:sulfur carrier protein